MNRHDVTGNPIGNAVSDDALARYQTALVDFHCYAGDPLAAVNEVLELEPDFAMARLFRGWLQALGTDPAGIDAAREDVTVVEALRPNERETLHARALAAFCKGRWANAAELTATINERWPRDALALQAGHLIDFYRGDSPRLHSRIAAALPHWGQDDRSHGALLGMLAFGSEEGGDYEGALAQGNAALEANPRDAWAHHAVAHVHEMRGDVREGVRWMRGREAQWAPDNFLAVHNWWHLALFHLDLGELDEALALFDGPVHGARSTLMLDLVDASALLWRLQMMGAPVGDRWKTVAEAWHAGARPGLYSFNDYHAMMAWIGAGDDASADRWRAAQACVTVEVAGDHAALAHEIGAPLLRALEARSHGRAAEASTLLRNVRPTVIRFGGSHAQRDIVDLMTIDAAIAAGETDVAAAMIRERLARKPASAINRVLASRMVPSSGAVAAAIAAS